MFCAAAAGWFIIYYLLFYLIERAITNRHARRLTAIASCYIGDIAPRHNKKKSIVLPTLIVNLRAEIQLSSKSFRRRSHDVPTREGAKRERAGREILYFRPAPDNIVAIETWAREIQSYLIPSSADSNTAAAIESAFRAKFSELDLDAPTSPSMFFINGEPSTALLSPSIRSRASNLSSIESDDKSIMSSVGSELPSYRNGDEVSPRSSGIDGRPPLHVVTKMRHTIGADSRDDYFVNTPVAVPARRETILDRFFSSTAPSSPNFPPDPAPMNSIARFEALIRDIESGRDLEPQNLHPDLRAHPKRIPSPTQRALEYVSTGLLLSHLDNDEAPPDADPTMNPHLNVGTFSRGLSRQASEASLGTTASMAGSHVETNLGVSNSKRHSMADFSIMRLATTPPLFHLAGERRGSYSDVPRIAESCEDDSGGGGGGPGRSEFGSHPRVARPLFREFSF